MMTKQEGSVLAIEFSYLISLKMNLFLVHIFYYDCQSMHLHSLELCYFDEARAACPCFDVDGIYEDDFGKCSLNSIVNAVAEFIDLNIPRV